MADANVSFENNAGQNSVEISHGVNHSPKRSICLFKRSSGNFLNLRYNSKVLEDYYQESSLTYAIYRYKCSCLFLIFVAITWLIFAILRGQNYLYYVIGFVAAILIFAILFGLAYAEDLFKKHHLWFYLADAIFMAIFSLLCFATNLEGADSSYSLVFNTFVVMQCVLLLYTMVPVRLWQAMLIGALLSIAFIILSIAYYRVLSIQIIIPILLAHIVFHLVGLVHHLILQARRRSSFLKLGQIARLKLKIKDEKNSKEEMIQSLMPLHVAQEVMAGKKKGDGEGDDGDDRMGTESENKEEASSNDDEDSDDDEGVKMKKLANARGSRPSRQIDMGYQDDADGDATSNLSDQNVQTAQVEFRKFHVNQMKDVSILFADIVGFTKMSSNKTAPHLVFLLNDLFGRFDKLCEINGCEKIATLGDCYYCVAGCPRPAEDHAERCVEMGRSMCVAIQQFDERHNEEVNMRVGVHTGTVTCGIVGTHRFKFDVWSHDVTLANEMESSGEAGWVHISAETHEFVKDIYDVESAVELSDFRKLNVLTEYFDNETQSYAIKHVQEKTTIQTFLVVDRKDKKPVKLIEEEDTSPPSFEQNEANKDNQNNIEDEKKKMIPATEQITGVEEGLNDDDVVRCLKEDPQLMISLFKPPINYCSLQFNAEKLESKYHHAGLRRHQSSKRHLTWAHHRLTPLLDTAAHCLFSVLVIISCFVAFPGSSWYTGRPAFYILAILLVILNLILLIPLLIDFRLLDKISASFDSCYRQLFSWIPRHLICPFLLALPACLVLAHFQPCYFVETSLIMVSGLPGYRVAFGICILLSLSGLSLFSWFSTWAKLATGLLISIIATLLLILVRYTNFGGSTNTSACFLPPFLHAYSPEVIINNSTYANVLWIRSASSQFMEVEIAIALILTIVLALFLAREVEISHRASFCCDDGARQARRTIAEERRQADWLLENIIPRYVIESVKTEKKYSQHITRVGVIFATIANFSDFYDEQYEGGREMLRVLNEIFADFENLLSKPKFDDVEKIKTIGSCFMAASGLNPDKRAIRDVKNPNGHLYALMDFSLDLVNTLNAFNQQLFNFDFELKIGYNIGDVTAGVIGTTKLLYDIWGDTVNVASRMYSTGEKGRIQVTEAVKLQLDEKYDFSYRGEVEVKGKGKMKTYLLEGKKKSGGNVATAASS